VSTQDSQGSAPAPAPSERELTLAPEGSRGSGSHAASVRLLDAGVRSLAAQVEALRQRVSGRPAAFFTRWERWRGQWAAFARRHTQEPERPMSAEERARLRRYVEQYESIRQGVIRALALPSDRPPGRDEGGWPWWVWALLLGGGAAVAWNVSKRRSE